MSKIFACDSATAALLSAMILATPAKSETYGHMPEAPIRLGGGFSIITPEKVFPPCVVANEECQASARGSISCVSPNNERSPQYLLSDIIDAVEIQALTQLPALSTEGTAKSGGVPGDTAPKGQNTEKVVPPEVIAPRVEGDQAQFIGESPSQNFAPTTNFSLREIRSKSDYFHELNITASVSGSYGIFSGGASFSYNSIDDIDENSVSWAITAKSHYGSFTLAEPRVGNIPAGANVGRVIDMCGPQYVAEVDRGVLASVLYTFHSKSEKKLREVSAGLNAGLNAGVWSASGSVAFSDFMKSMVKSGQVSIRVFTIGGEGVTTLSELITDDPTDLNGIKGVLAAYVKNQSIDSSAILGFRTASMGRLLGHPEVDPDFSSYLQFLERINTYRLTLEEMSRDLQDHLIKLSDFPQSSADELHQVETELNCEISLINVTAASCRLWNDSLAGLLVNGAGSDDALARSTMLYNMFLGDDTKLMGAANQSYPLAVVDEVKPSVCSQELESALGTAKKVSDLRTGTKTLEATLKDGDTSPCVFSVNTALLSKLNDIPKFPFEFSYYLSVFGSSAANPVAGDMLYIRLEEAEKVDFVQLFTDDLSLLWHESNDQHLPTFGFSVPVRADMKGHSVRVVFQTLPGSAYDYTLDVPS